MRISSKNLQRFAGRRLFLQLEPTKPAKHINGVVSDSILRFHFGIGFDQYLARGGSVVRLARLWKDGSVAAS